MLRLIPRILCQVVLVEAVVTQHASHLPLPILALHPFFVFLIVYLLAFLLLFQLRLLFNGKLFLDFLFPLFNFEFLVGAPECHLLIRLQDFSITQTLFLLPFLQFGI